MSRLIPVTPVNVCGVVTGWPPSVNCRPLGSVARVTVVVFGTTSRVTWWVSPTESFTVRWMR